MPSNDNLKGGGVNVVPLGVSNNIHHLLTHKTAQGSKYLTGYVANVLFVIVWHFQPSHSNRE